MTVPGRLEVDAGSGKVTGPAAITHNDPFPTANGTPDGSGTMLGTVMHTMAGNLPGTVSWFNDTASSASAHFGISQAGEIHQFGPIGKGWAAWAQAAGNRQWYSIEHADNTDPAIPLTVEQVTASAQLLELLSRFAGFPLEVSDSTGTPGYVCHSDGGAAWGGHLSCPGPVRAAQRHQVVALAREIRDYVKVTTWHASGMLSWNSEAKAHHTTVLRMIELANKAGHDYRPKVREAIARADWDARVPAGAVLYAAEN